MFNAQCSIHNAQCLHCAFCIRREAAAGGGSRTRTGDIRLAKPTLYQLSYAPEAGAEGGVRQHRSFARGFAFILGGGASKLASAMCRRVRPNGPVDELTIGIPVARVRLLRKEVIQPQVPLRLPCYDFIPITTHTLGDSPPCGLGRRLRVQTAFMM